MLWPSPQAKNLCMVHTTVPIELSDTSATGTMALVEIVTIISDSVNLNNMHNIIMGIQLLWQST